MGLSDDLKELTERHNKLSSSVTMLKNELNATKDILATLTTENIEMLILKSKELDESFTKASGILSESEILKKEFDEIVKSMRENSSSSNASLEEVRTLESKINSLLKSAEGAISKINESVEQSSKDEESLNEIINRMSSSSQKLQEIDTMYTSAIDTKGKIDLLLTNFEKKYSEINTQHTRIFGYKKDDSNEKVPGLKDELDASYLALKDASKTLSHDINIIKEDSTKNVATIKSTWENELEEIKKAIYDLLPSALTAGLSHAYEEKKKTENEEKNSSNTTFWRAIIALALISCIPFGLSFYLRYELNKEVMDVVLAFPQMACAVLPLYIPALWVAYSSSKKINLSKRLIEEYAHKSALAKTFEGLSTQINEMKDSDIRDDLRAKLLFNLLEASAENPGKLISDYKNADHPLMDALDKSIKLGDSIAKLANVPGLTKLTQMAVKKKEKEERALATKVEDGLNAINQTDEQPK